ncbi:MAG: hypothetical protein IPM63_11745 [Acidobacteriota bacterium]|nr:MAG: hypothetical protein IPM63_11745 [Acidobacteriota bacterium]
MNLVIMKPEEVWCGDTCHPGGFRTRMDAPFCVEAPEKPNRLYGTPGIFNTVQGAHFTSLKFTLVLEVAGVRISMEGRSS